MGAGMGLAGAGLFAQFPLRVASGDGDEAPYLDGVQPHGAEPLQPVRPQLRDDPGVVDRPGHDAKGLAVALEPAIGNLEGRVRPGSCRGVGQKHGGNERSRCNAAEQAGNSHLGTGPAGPDAGVLPARESQRLNLRGS